MLVLAIVAGACDEDPPPEATPPDAASPETTETTPAVPRVITADRCPNETDAPAREPVGGRVPGDVDGDGAQDDVFLVRDPAAEAGCRLLLVADAGELVYVVPAGDEGVESSLQMPRINSLVHVDGRDGLEILVDLEAGASTQFLAMYTVTDGTLQRVRIEGAGPVGDLLPYGGSVGHVEGTDCGSRPGTVVVGLATPAGRMYEFRTTTYEMEGASLREVPEEEPPRILHPSELGDVAQFSTSPFGTCHG